MKYREEVVAKIFTYFTVFVLIGIIAFEAYMVQTERNKMAELNEQYLQAQNDLMIVRELNYDLLTTNETLLDFKDHWMPYAAYTEVSEAEKFKTDLFSRKSLIPEEALDDWRQREYLTLLALEEELTGEEENAQEDDSEAEEDQEVSAG